MCVCVCVWPVRGRRTHRLFWEYREALFTLTPATQLLLVLLVMVLDFMDLLVWDFVICMIQTSSNIAVFTLLFFFFFFALYSFVCVSTQLCLILCDPLDCSPPGFSVHGVLQARILEWVAISFSRGSSRPRDQTPISCISYIGKWILYHCATWEAVCILLTGIKKSSLKSHAKSNISNRSNRSSCD